MSAAQAVAACGAHAVNYVGAVAALPGGALLPRYLLDDSLGVTLVEPLLLDELLLELFDAAGCLASDLQHCSLAVSAAAWHLLAAVACDMRKHDHTERQGWRRAASCDAKGSCSRQPWLQQCSFALCSAVLHADLL